MHILHRHVAPRPAQDGQGRGPPRVHLLKAVLKSKLKQDGVKDKKVLTIVAQIVAQHAQHFSLSFLCTTHEHGAKLRAPEP